MTNIRRYKSTNQTIFITAVCYQRIPILVNNPEKQMLLEILREVKSQLPFRLMAYVILNDHFHCLIRPEDGSDFSRIVQSIKLRFTHRWKADHGINTPVKLWQRRFWDYVIRDTEDLHRHLAYIHFNPVKHGLVTDPADWHWSSFKAHQAKGRYPLGWGVAQIDDAIKTMNLE
jgi:putative transposase